MKKLITFICLLGYSVLITSCATNLLTAADTGNMGEVDKAILHGDDVNKKDANGNTPLILAAKHGDFAIVKKLVIKGANIEAKNAEGYDPLLALTNYTMKNAPTVEKETQKSNPLPITTEGHLKTAEYLIQNGADVNAVTLSGNTPLILAADLNKLKLLELFLSKGADINARNKEGYSALIVASSRGNRELICPLIKKGADKNVKDNQGKTALQYAEQYDQKEIIPLLNSPCPTEDSDSSGALVAGESLVEKLIASLKDRDPSIRWEAAMRLGDLKDPRAVVPLINALTDGHAYVRRRAAFALGELHDFRAIDSLINELHDEDSFAKKFALESLEKITGQQLGNDSKNWAEWWTAKIRQNEN